MYLIVYYYIICYNSINKFQGVIIITTLFILGSIIIVTLIGLMLEVLSAIDKNNIIKQTQLIYEQSDLKNLKNKEVLDNMNCKL